MKKTILLALAAISALLALPALASATPAHVEPNPGIFSVHGGESQLTRAAGGNTHGETVTGSGEFENTTTGTVNLTFHHVTALTGTCTTAGHEGARTGTVSTTKLPFHLIMIAANEPGILITPNNGHFASFTCPLVNAHVKGTGIIGTIVEPDCGQSSTKATLEFSATEGVQDHLSWTGKTYDLESRISTTGAYSTSGMDAEATITFGGSTKLVCT